MNGERLQEKIYAGYAKAAAKAGRSYDLYRSNSPMSPIDSGNQIGTIDCFFAAEKRFEVPNKFKIPHRYLYADGRLLQQRDILLGPYGTFIVGDMQPLLPMQAIWCNDLIQIERAAYAGSSDGPVISPEPIAFAMPVFRQLKKVDQKPVGETFGATMSSNPIGEWFVFAPIDWTELKQGDIVTDQTGRQYTISVIDPTEIGTVLVIRQSETESGQ